MGLWQRLTRQSAQRSTDVPATQRTRATPSPPTPQRQRPTAPPAAPRSPSLQPSPEMQRVLNDFKARKAARNPSTPSPQMQQHLDEFKARKAARQSSRDDGPGRGPAPRR